MQPSYFKIFTVLTFVWIYFPVQAQRTCAVDFPQSKDQFEGWMNNQQSAKAFGLFAQTQQQNYIIPVIVHIIHNDESPGTNLNISWEQVQSQLKVLNEDFRRMNADTVNTPSIFADVAASFNIEFKAALRDPSGNLLSEPGVNRVSRNTNGWAAPPYSKTFVNEVIQPATYWDPERYLNIWVTSLSSGLFGFAQFPVAVDDLPDLPGDDIAERDGVVIHYQYFGRGESFNLSPNFNKGRTTTHELGHWLGLYHVWGEGGCSSDDLCEDTPAQEGPNSGCPDPQSSAAFSCGNREMFENFMDYTHDNCMNIFTLDQRSRAHVVLNNAPRREELQFSDVWKPIPNAPEDFYIIANQENIILLDWKITDELDSDSITFYFAQGNGSPTFQAYGSTKPRSPYGLVDTLRSGQDYLVFARVYKNGMVSESTDTLTFNNTCLEPVELLPGRYLATVEAREGLNGTIGGGDVVAPYEQLLTIEKLATDTFRIDDFSAGFYELSYGGQMEPRDLIRLCDLLWIENEPDQFGDLMQGYGLFNGQEKWELYWYNSWGDSLRAFLDYIKIPEIQNVTLVDAGPTHLELSWEFEDYDYLQGFLVERFDEIQEVYVVLDSLTEMPESFVDSSLEANTSYQYRIRAFDEFQLSEPFVISFSTTDQLDQFLQLDDLVISYDKIPYSFPALTDVGLEVTYTLVGGGGSINGNTLASIDQIGNLELEATQEGDAMYKALEPILFSVEVTLGIQSIIISSATSQSFPSDPFSLDAAASSGLPLTFEILSGPASLTAENQILAEGTGDVTVRISQDGNDFYGPAEPKEITFKIKNNQGLTFEPIPNKTFGDPPFKLVVQSDTDIPIQFKVLSGPAEIFADSVHLQGAGLVSIQAFQEETEEFGPSSKTRTFSVAKAPQSITWNDLSISNLSANVLPMIGSASSSLPLSYVVLEGDAFIQGNSLIINSAGTIEVMAFQPGDENYLPSDTLYQSLELEKQDQQILFEPVEDKLANSPPIPFQPLATSDLPVSRKILKGQVSIAGNQIFIQGSGEVLIEMVQGGNGLFHPADTQYVNFMVHKVNQTVSLDSVAPTPVNDLSVNLKGNASSGLPLEIKVLQGPGNVRAKKLTFEGVGWIRLMAFQKGNHIFAPSDTVYRWVEVLKPHYRFDGTYQSNYTNWNGADLSLFEVKENDVLYFVKKIESNGKGDFNFQRIPVGTYVVKIEPKTDFKDDIPMLTAYWEGQPFWHRSDLITVSAGPVSIEQWRVDLRDKEKIDKDLKGKISGTIELDDEIQSRILEPWKELDEVIVFLLDKELNTISHVFLNHQGEFAFEYLKAGTYEVLVDIPGKLQENPMASLELPTFSTHMEVKGTLDNSGKLSFEIINADYFPNDVGAGIRFFPNPVKDNMRIELPSSIENEEISLKIFSFHGKKLYETNIFVVRDKNFIDISLCFLGKGYYLFEISSRNERFFERFIKE